jgi:hypothetical protein
LTETDRQTFFLKIADRDRHRERDRQRQRDREKKGENVLCGDEMHTRQNRPVPFYGIVVI